MKSIRDQQTPFVTRPDSLARARTLFVIQAKIRAPRRNRFEPNESIRDPANASGDGKILSFVTRRFAAVTRRMRFVSRRKPCVTRRMRLVSPRKPRVTRRKAQVWPQAFHEPQ